MIVEAQKTKKTPKQTRETLYVRTVSNRSIWYAPSDKIKAKSHELDVTRSLHNTLNDERYYEALKW